MKQKAETQSRCPNAHQQFGEKTNVFSGKIVTKITETVSPPSETEIENLEKIINRREGQQNDRGTK